MDHPLERPLTLDSTDALIRPWRTAAIVAAAIAAVELLLLLVVGGGALVNGLADRIRLEAQQTVAAPTADAPRAKPTARRRLAFAPAAQLPRKRTRVVVLNGNGRTGAAAAAAQRVSRRGYRVGRVGNASRTDFARSVVMYRPGFAGEGRRFARDLGVRQAGPLDGIRVRELGRAHVVYILGR